MDKKELTYGSGEGVRVSNEEGLDIIKSLELSLDMIDSASQKKEDVQYHMGSNIFGTVKKDSLCVDIRLYWRPPTKKNLNQPRKVNACAL